LAGAGAAVSLSSFIEVRANSEQKKATQKIKALNLGMASYTFRRFSLEETLVMTKRLGLRRIAFKDFHLPLKSSEAEINAVSKRVRDANFELYGCGVVYMENETEVEQAFKYARAAGMKVIIGVPSHELLNSVNKKVQEFDIKLAIHNHGPEDKRYPTPESVYEKIRGLDPRLGLCLDIGHAQRAGLDPSECAKKFAERLLDVHIKDVTASSKEGMSIEVGRGVVDIPKFLQTLLKLDYSGTVALEYEKDENDPLPGAAESIGYIRGVLAVL
jgi:sugar phosphate isomerase/epimerase